MKFTETVHCKSRAHCGACLTSIRFKVSMKLAHDGFGTCPLSDGEKEEIVKKYLEESKKPKAACRGCAERRRAAGQSRRR